MTNTRPAFSKEQFNTCQLKLAGRVAHMMGRKLEEGDWSAVYCAAKAIPRSGWSNLNIDVVHDGIGVEHKMLRVAVERKLADVPGTTLMHPAATRAIRIPATNDPTEAMTDVLGQYAQLIESRRRKVADSKPGYPPDLRTGWLLWQSNLVDFLYFEEETVPPRPDDYYAVWKRSGGGVRRESRNLWVYEKISGRKRYSITTEAGAKIQPYFDVPPPTDANLYTFRVQGEPYEGKVRMWLTAQTRAELARVVGLDPDAISDAILASAAQVVDGGGSAEAEIEDPVSILVSTEAYAVLTGSFNGVSDEHRIQLLLRQVQSLSK